jgi:hypothetical protein
MKLLLENWREYLNEEVYDSKKMPRALETSMLGHATRLIVVINTSNGPQAFYQSTGTGTPELDTGDMWLPAGGIARKSNGDPWLMKHPAGKMPAQGTELYNIGVRLAKAYERKPFEEDDIWSWATSQGAPSMQDARNAGVNTFDYGPVLFNWWLNKHGALKNDWAQGSTVMGSKEDSVNLRNLVTQINQGSQQ